MWEHAPVHIPDSVRQQVYFSSRYLFQPIRLGFKKSDNESEKKYVLAEKFNSEEYKSEPR